MLLDRPGAGGWTRRAFVSLAGVSLLRAERNIGPRGETLPSEAKRYSDPATEFVIVRLTEPSYSSFLTAAPNRCVTKNYVVCSSSRAGKLDAWRVDFRSGAWRRLTDASNLDPNSVALTPDERTLCFIDGTSARAVTQSNLKERELYHTGIEGAALTSLTLHPEGNQVFLVEQRGDVSRVIALSLAHGSPSELLTAGGRIERVLPRPGRGFAYRIEDRVYLSGTSTRGTGAPAPLALAPGRTGPVFWSPDGASLLYLNIPDKAGQLHTIREYVVATGEDRLVAKTTQFVEFVPNADASVFLGASGSKASPHVLLLVRNVRRELTLCEHRAKNPSSLAVAFSPNSQRVVYQSDEHGSPAIYTLAVERFVAETES